MILPIEGFRNIDGKISTPSKSRIILSFVSKTGLIISNKAEPASGNVLPCITVKTLITHIFING